MSASRPNAVPDSVAHVDLHTGIDRVVLGDLGSPRCNTRRRAAYVRYFPERLSHLLDSLTAQEMVAKLRLDRELALRDGDLPADDKLLATVTKLSDKAWASLRDKLVALGLARIENGKWFDEDQVRSLEIQRNSRLRGQRGAQARWGGLRAA